MAYTSYTPGPWRLGSACDPPDGFVWAPDDDELVAVAGYDCSDLPTLTRAANARLIAAAPELLAALEFAARFIADEVEQRGLAGSDMSDYQDEAAQALECVEAAITKAKGV